MKVSENCGVTYVCVEATFAGNSTCQHQFMIQLGVLLSYLYKMETEHDKANVLKIMGERELREIVLCAIKAGGLEAVGEEGSFTRCLIKQYIDKIKFNVNEPCCEQSEVLKNVIKTLDESKWKRRVLFRVLENEEKKVATIQVWTTVKVNLRNEETKREWSRIKVLVLLSL